jgi:hypothetical protein
MCKVGSSGAGGRSLGDEKRGTAVESAGSRSVGGVGRDRAGALEPAGRSVAVGAEHAVGKESVGVAEGAYVERTAGVAGRDGDDGLDAAVVSVLLVLQPVPECWGEHCREIIRIIKSQAGNSRDAMATSPRRI